MFVCFIQIRFTDKVLIACQHMIFFLIQFRWQFTSAYLSVKWVINSSSFFSNLFFFLLQLLHCHLSYVKSLLINTFQHWLLYNKLSSNNNINNYHHVSVIQVCVLKLTTCRALVLYNTYIITFVCVNADVNSVLEVDQQQLALYTHFSQTMVILALLNDNVLFVQNCITLQQMRTHQSLYINAILIQSQSVLISDSCINCQKCSMTLFLKCHYTSEHFSKCYDNCKWCDHAVCCSVCNDDVLIIILNDENNDDINENKHVVKLRQIASISLLVRAVVINLNL